MIVEKANGESKAGLRVLGPWEMITHSMGIRFPEVVKQEDPSIYFSIKELKENYGFLCYKGRRPVVIMPEGTKTNGLGILNIERDIIEMIAKACEADQGLKIHAIRFDHIFKHFSPYNSYDSNGIWNAMGILCQFTSRMKVQYYFNI